MKFKDMKSIYKVGIIISGILLVFTGVICLIETYKTFNSPTDTHYINTSNVELLNTVGLISFVGYAIIMIWRNRDYFMKLNRGIIP